MISKPAKITIAVLVFLFLAGGAGLYFYRDFIDKKAGDIIAGQTSGPREDGSKEEKPQEELAKIPAPDLDRPIVITAKLSEESAEKAKEYITNSQNALKGDLDLYDDWLNLALYRKLIGDYEAAREIWEYVTKIRPFAAVSFHNLGNLYAYELQDPDKAETYYLKAMELEPSGIQWYIAASEYYRYFKKDIPKAKAVLKTGISANPGDETLAQMLKNF